MRKVFVSVIDCYPGMKMAETIFNEYGAVIVAENTILDAHLIKKLDNLGFLKVKIYEQSADILLTGDAELFKAQYNENIDIAKSILHDISIGKNINIEAVNNVSESTIIRINENRDIVGCINEIRGVDEYTYTHSVNVSLLCMLIGKWLKLDIDKIKLLIQAGLLHDLGKSKISPEIINKPGPLTTEEFAEMKKHTTLGYRLLESTNKFSKDICLGVLMHHEREDGTGYPMGVKGSQIHEFAKIIAVADIYDAMTSNRAYRGKESPFEVLELMEKNTFGILDMRVISVFLNNIAAYYIGDFVVLNTGETGEIIYINPRYISKPLVKCGSKYIDLSVDSRIKILELK
ncbi:MAG: HD-GYP domain-containing protein [Clostridia bacterium]|nr:HD-GYP domain-containing protein [Clostridia bacterium]